MRYHDFSTENPVFIDLETFSGCDLRAEGGWNYAAHHTTKLLTVAWSSEPGEFHLWLPHHNERYVSEEIRRMHLGEVHAVHFGEEFPDALRAVTGRPWYAHNAWTFDQLVWEQLAPDDLQPVRWGDTYPLALASGLPGGLNAIGKYLWGEGKYEAGNAVAKRATRLTPALKHPADVGAGDIAQVGRYNVQDVRLLGWLWEEVVRTLRMPEDEFRVLQTHAAINARGVRVDKELLSAVIDLSIQCQVRAVDEIARLTDGRFKTKKDLGQRTKINAWLTAEGVDLGGSLRKEVIMRWVESLPQEDDDDQESDGGVPDASGDEGGPGLTDRENQVDLVKVAKVLILRQAATRITDAKAAAASQSLNRDGRVRGLFVYWGAHTGRWAGRRIQVQNLPRPKEGVYTWGILDVLQQVARADLPSGQTRDYYGPVRALLPIGKGPQYRFLSVDDAASAMIRSLFLPDDGRTLAAADLSNIEARVLAWLAGEKWLMDAFWEGKDPYLLTAARIFGPPETWPAFPDPEKPGEFLSLKKHPYRQAGKVVELGSGYQLGSRQFAIYAAAQGIDLPKVGTTAEACIRAYRESHTAIAGAVAGEFDGKPYFKGGYWDKLNAASIAAVEQGGAHAVGPIVFEKSGGHLYVTLPSGRNLTYRNARVEEHTPPYAKGSGRLIRSVWYTSPRGFRNPMYGGKWAENVVQATARDFIAASAVRCEERDMPWLIHVHDEGVGSVKDEPASLDAFMSAMTELPAWAPDFPLDAEGSLLPRYAKSPPKGVKEVVYRNGRPHK